MHKMSETTEETADKMSGNKVSNVSKWKKNPSREDKMDEGRKLLYLWECVKYTQLCKTFREKITDTIRKFTVIMD